MIWKLPNTKKLSNKMMEAIWESFLANGTTHSASAMTLEHIMNRCEREHVLFTLRASPGQGYHIEVYKDDNI